MWTQADFNDIAILAEMFWGHLIKNPNYISHGEMQMGVADSPGDPAIGGKQKWIRYISGKMNREETQLPAGILVYKEKEAIQAFCVLEIEEDGDKPYGVICDMLVLESFRGKGLGKQMFEQIMNWFREYGVEAVYLESGVNNHPAHAFFEKMGFFKVSHIFKLER